MEDEIVKKCKEIAIILETVSTEECFEVRITKNVAELIGEAQHTKVIIKGVE